jgi:hypothetical protein
VAEPSSSLRTGTGSCGHILGNAPDLHGQNCFLPNVQLARFALSGRPVARYACVAMTQIGDGPIKSFGPTPGTLAVGSPAS